MIFVFVAHLVWALAAAVIVLRLQRRTDKLAGKVSELEHFTRTHVGAESFELRIQSLLRRIESLERRTGEPAQEPPALVVDLDEAAESPARPKVEIYLSAVEIGLPEAAAPPAPTVVDVNPDHPLRRGRNYHRSARIVSVFCADHYKLIIKTSMCDRTMGTSGCAACGTSCAVALALGGTIARRTGGRKSVPRGARARDGNGRNPKRIERDPKTCLGPGGRQESAVVPDRGD